MTLLQSLADAIPLTRAADFVPGRPHHATVFRWATRGVRGVKLATWRCGNKIFTTPEAIEEFLRELNRDAAAEIDAAEAVRRGREAGKALEAMGL